MKFEPWEKFKNTAPLPLNDEIKEPPCTHCQWWAPRVTTNENGVFAGIKLCITPGDMEHDFSCYKAINGED